MGRNQNPYLDSKILDLIKSGQFLVDAQNGSVFGRILFDGTRKKLGFYQRGNKYPKTTVYFNGANRTVEIPRIIWLSVFGEVPDGMRVSLKQECDGLGIDNLMLVRNEKYFGLWSSEEVKKLKESLHLKSWDKISKFVGRTEKSCRQKAIQLSLSKIPRKRPWSHEEDLELKRLLSSWFGIKEIATRMGRGFSSILIHSKKFGKSVKPIKGLRKELSKNRFYTSIKAAKIYGSVVLSCCVCGKEDYRYCTLHHIDGNRKNNHISNISTLCPCCHAEVHGGDLKSVKLYSVWKRIYNDGTKSEVETNLQEIVHV